jgi:formate dehydrogenase subunit beta
MERVVRALDARERGADAAVRDLLWRLMELDIVHGLLVPLQTHPNEAPAPTLIKNRERLEKATPLAPLTTLNSAKIVALLLPQESQKHLAAVMRPCEVRALFELSRQGQVILDDLITVGVDCVESQAQDSSGGRAHHLGRACQICEQPTCDRTDITIGLLGQDLDHSVLVYADDELAARIGLYDDGVGRPATEAQLVSRQEALDRLVAGRRQVRQRLLDEMQRKTAELGDLLALFSTCTLCGECQEACPLTPLCALDLDAYEDNTPAYVAARFKDLVQRAEWCTGCGMCEAVCHMGIPLTLLMQMIVERAPARRHIVTAFGGPGV